MSQDYFVRSMRALQLGGMSERTQEAYTRAVRMLVEFCGKPPEQITEIELEEYFLHRRNVDKWSASTLRIAYSGVRFFFTHVLERDWHLFTYLHAKRAQQLPCILDRDEVYQVLRGIRTFHNYACLATIYACGLRVSEALALQIADIDGKRRMLHVHRGKGAKDRYVPLPDETYQLLRRYWATHRNPVFIFPAVGRGHQQASTSTQPMAISSVQGAFREAARAAGTNKRRVSIHTLRHCYATHLLEAGVNVRVVQRYMGHSKLETTMIYLHLTRKGTEDACAIINQTMNGFQFNHDHHQ
jgi:integrase/recombinase XerD